MPTVKKWVLSLRGTYFPPAIPISQHPGRECRPQQRSWKRRRNVQGSLFCSPGLAGRGLALDVETILHLAAKFEFWVFAVTFLIAVCILSMKTALFVLSTVLEHSFPRWRDWIARPKRTSVNESGPSAT